MAAPTRIAALMHAASAAEAQLELEAQSDEVAKAAWCLAPGKKRLREYEEEHHAAHKRPHSEQGQGAAGGDSSSAEQQALMQKWMIEHALVVQKMAQVAAVQSTKRKREGGSEGRGERDLCRRFVLSICAGNGAGSRL